MADRVYLTDIKRDMAEGTHAAKHTRYFHDIHTHDFYNIAWVEHGGFDYMVDTKKYHVEDKSILMFVPGGMHCLKNTNVISGTTIDFTEDFFLGIHSVLAHTIKFDIMEGLHVLPIRNPQTEKKIKELIALLRTYVQNTDTSTIAIAQTYSVLTLIFCAIANSPEFSAARPLVKAQNRELYLSFMDKIEHHFRMYHSVRFYAEELAVSVNALTLCCKANAGKTPAMLITKRILLEAKRMLLYSNLRSKEISTQLGFIEPAHFLNFFKKHMKESPLKYRENNSQIKR